MAAPKARHIRTQSNGARVETVQIGRVWTFITIRLPTDKLAVKAVQAHFGIAAKVKS